MCRHRSSCASDASPGSVSARNRPKCASRVAIALTVFGRQVALLRRKVGHECRTQWPGDAGHPGLKRCHDLGWRRRAVQDLQVEQHLPGGMQR